MTNSANTQLILIINTDGQTNFLFERILESMGYLVEISPTLSDIEKFFSPTPPTLIIVNEWLILENHFAWVKDIHQLFPLLPIVVYSSKENSQLQKEAFRLGVNDFLHPPVTRDELVNTISSNIQKALTLKNHILLESRRATQQLQARVNELEVLIRLGRSVTSSLDLDEVLRLVVDSAVVLTGSEEGSLLLVDEMTGDLYMRASKNFNNEFVNTFRLPVHDSLAGSVLQTGEPVILDEDTPQKIKTSYLVHSLIYVPLKLRDKVIGILGIDNRHVRVSFRQKDILLLSTLAEYAVIAIENARLYTETTNEKNKVAAIMGEIEDGVLVLDQDHRVILINQMARLALEIDTQAGLGVPIQAIIENQELLDLVLNIDSKVSHQLEITSSTERVYSVQLTPILSVGLALTLHDITYLKKLDRIKSDFVNTVSHDLRSPLTAILGYAELIERAGEINELQKEFINRVQASVQNITTLVDDLLNLGRIESGFDTRKDLIDLETTIRHAIDDLYSRLKIRNQTVNFINNGPLPALYANHIQIRQLLDNLITNACKYSAEGSTITVETFVEQKQVILRVSDQGIGIPQVDIPFIFDKFYRSGNISNETPGSGLGLAIVKSIVDNHQGRIWVDSTVNQGSVFTIVLPVAE
jgi:two-component system NtrC family sensor kinase